MNNLLKNEALIHDIRLQLIAPYHLNDLKNDKDKFLIDNQKCLSAINETPGNFPQWLPASVHHTCYDCLRCQEKCPMNLDQKMNERIIFSEQKTEILLEGKPIEDFSESAKQKIHLLGLDEWYRQYRETLKL